LFSVATTRQERERAENGEKENGEKDGEENGKEDGEDVVGI
jgi:hypothetical protein